MKNLDNMNPKVRGTLMGLTLILIILVLMGIGTSIFKDNDTSYIKDYECKMLVDRSVAEALELQEEHWVGGILYLYYPMVKVLLFAVALAWILHGVGFHIIKR